MNQISPRFVRGLQLQLGYWQKQSEFMRHDQQMKEYSEEHPNLVSLITLGLQVDETRIAAAETILCCFPLIERCGFWQEWLTLINRVANSLQTEHHLLQQQLLNCWGILLRLSGQLEAAITAHRQVASLSLPSENLQAKAEACFYLSETYRLSRNYVLAKEFGAAALDYFAQSADVERWYAATLNTLGLIALDEEDWATAETHLQQAIKLWRTLEQPTELARSLSNLALVFQRRKEMEKALAFYEESLLILHSTSSTLTKLRVLNSLGTLYMYMGNLSQAEATLRQADAPVLRASGDAETRAAIAHNLGEVLLRQKLVKEAAVYLRLAITRWQQIGHELRQANSLGTVGEALEVEATLLETTENGGEVIRARRRILKRASGYYCRAGQLLKKYPNDKWARQWRTIFDERLQVLKQGIGEMEGCDL